MDLQLITTEFLTASRREKKRRSVAGVDQEQLVEAEALVDPDSSFYNFNGTRIHHKICHGGDEADQSTAGSERIGLSMVLLHGFAAWVFSWGEVTKPLARLTGSKVLAFDRPGFGLTPRVSRRSGDFGTKSEVNPYSMAFSASATLSFLDLLGAHKGILMGHSAGCFVAVDAYFKAPDRVSALILVAPAIVAPFHRALKSSDEDEMAIKRSKSQTGQVVSGFQENVWNGLARLYMVVLSILVQVMKGMKVMIHSLYKRILSAFLRSTFAVFLIRLVLDKFGITIVRKAWFDDSKVTDHIIQNYTRPLKVRGWEMALLEHILSVLTDSSESMRPFNRRLSEISCPVLIVTGDSDRIVPVWNSTRLSSAIAGSTFEVIKDCGHLPHEEKPEDFLVVVDKFLRRISTTQPKP